MMDLNTLAIKLDKANSLRLKSNAAMREENKIVTEWVKREKKCKSINEFAKINAEYSKKLKSADKKEDAAYKKYYDYVDKNFDKKIVKEIAAEGIFDKREFINRLGMEIRNQIKKEKKR